MSQPFILNDERLMGQSNHRMPVAAKKGVEGGTASLLIFLSLGDEAKDEGSDLMRREPLPTKQGFQFQQQIKGGGGFLCSHPEVGVALHSRFQKREKRKFRKRKIKKTNKTINYQSSWKGTPLAEVPTKIDIFPPS